MPGVLVARRPAVPILHVLLLGVASTFIKAAILLEQGEYSLQGQSERPLP